MNTTFVANTQLTTINCSCGGVYAIQEKFRLDKKEEGSSWTCPYCRTWWGYANNGTNAQLKREIEEKDKEIARQKANAEYWHDRKQEAQAEAAHFRKSRDGVRGALARTRNRIGNGVCPCCNRSFSELLRHMETKHPDYRGKVDV